MSNVPSVMLRGLLVCVTAQNQRRHLTKRLHTEMLGHRTRRTSTTSGRLGRWKTAPGNGQIQQQIAHLPGPTAPESAMDLKVPEAEKAKGRKEDKQKGSNSQIPRGKDLENSSLLLLHLSRKNRLNGQRWRVQQLLPHPSPLQHQVRPHPRS